MFLLINDITGYKLANNVYDLTKAQIDFYQVCAEKVHNELEKVKNNTNDNASDKLKIDTMKDSPEDIRNKLDMFKAGMR